MSFPSSVPSPLPAPPPISTPLSPTMVQQPPPGVVMALSSPLAAGRRTAGPLRQEALLLLLLMLLMLASVVCGQYDRGGPQHTITWGRGNSPSSAVFASPPTNVTAVRGHRALLPCKVKNLGNKAVSWIRQRDLHILTVGIFTYTTDDRFQVHHAPDTDDWHLVITSVTFRDSGVYECQVSTSPKVFLPIHLSVRGEEAAVIRGPGAVFVQRGSTISLECLVGAGSEAVGALRWFQGHNPLNYSSPRGGISMEVEKTPTQTTSRLYVTRAVRADSGKYTCSPVFARPASVTVHVVSAGEESAAAIQSVCVGARACGALVWVCVGVAWAALLATHPSSQPITPS